MDLMINSKKITKCCEEDLHILIDNPDYRENQYIDYKSDFSYFRAEGKEVKEKEAFELRKDICSFANAEGGFLIYGISERKGIASNILGVEIANCDKFENDVRNLFTPIMPKQPNVKFYFITLSAPSTYVVILQIERDYYAPYSYFEKEDNYKFSKRDGNHKSTIGYTELKNMFIQSRRLEDDILELRKQRIALRREENEKKKFVLLHLIPESFTTRRENLFAWEHTHQSNLGSVFSGTWIDSRSIPCVDGLRYISTERSREGIIFNSGVVEYYCSLANQIELGTDDAGTVICEEAIWSNVDSVIQGFQKIIPVIFGKQRYFACLCVVGCKDCISEFDYRERPIARVDRNMIICDPVIYIDMEDIEQFYKDMRQTHFEFLLSLGIRNSEEMQKLMKELRL